MDQGRVAARNMMGHVSPYQTVPFFWTSQYASSLRYAGHAHATDNILLQGSLTPASAAAFTAYFVVHGVVAAVATLNRDPVAVAAQELMRLRAMPTPAEVAATKEFDLVAHLAAVTRAQAGSR